ncbi:MAG: thiamine-binding protein [Gaiellaceae bacterium]
MLAEISVQPQVGRDIRPEITRALEEIEHAGMRYEAEPFGTVVEGDLEQILAAIRSIHGPFSADGIERFELHVRIRQEPGGASIERETAGFRERAAGKPEGMPQARGVATDSGEAP